MARIYSVMAGVAFNVWILFVLFLHSANGQQQATNKPKLNPYTLQYLKQLLARGGYTNSETNLFQPGNVPLASNLKLKSLSLSPALQQQNPQGYQVRPVSVNPQLAKALYGSVFLKPSGGQNDAGKYAYAQLTHKAPNQDNSVNPHHSSAGNLGNMLYQYAKQQEITQKQSPAPPQLNQNLYKMFGQMAYGPLPKPTNFGSSPPSRFPSYPSPGGYSQQQASSVNKNAFSPPPGYPPQMHFQQPKPSYQQQQQQPAHPPSYSAMSGANANQIRYSPAQAQNGYPSSHSAGHIASNNPYPAPPQQQHETPSFYDNAQRHQRSSAEFDYGSYGFSMDRGGSDKDTGGYDSPDWKGSIHISAPGTYDGPSFTKYGSPVMTAYSQPKASDSGYSAPSHSYSAPAQEYNPSPQGYSPPSQGYSSPQSQGYSAPRSQGYSAPQSQGYSAPSQGYGKPFIGAGTTCSDVPANFCHNKKAGHYSHPTNRHCFMQCDAFGRAYDKECAPGTSWKSGGPEPAYYNMCS